MRNKHGFAHRGSRIRPQARDRVVIWGRVGNGSTSGALGPLEGLVVARVGHRMWSVRDILTYEVLGTGMTGGDAIRAANARRFGEARFTGSRRPRGPVPEQRREPWTGQ